MEGEAEERAGEKGLFIHDPLFVAAAHELKSPLALVRQLALELDDTTISASDRQMIHEQIVLTSERALRLTTNLTKHARLEDSLFSLEPVNPHSLCDQVVEELQPLYRAKGRTLRLKHRRGSLLGLANKDLLRRILLNFADNALHYSASTSPVEVTVHATEGGHYIRMGVRDYGPAIPKTQWQSLRSVLGRQAMAMPTRPASSGLGMYIASQFAGAMNAKIGATRHKDGVTFYVDIHASAQMRLL